MGFNLRVLLHVSGLLLTIVAFSWCLLHTQYYATMLVLFIVLLLQVSALLRMIHATNRELVRFLEALKFADFTQSFSTTASSNSFRSLGQAFNEILERFRSSRSSKEQQAAYLQAVVQHLPVAVLAFNDEGKIGLSNTALLRLLGRTSAPASIQVLADSHNSLAAAVAALHPGKETTVKVQKKHENLNVKLSCTLLRIHGQQQKLVSIQNIAGELEARELEAWQNLIRVMTHEIMNSVTPITSLAETAEHYVAEIKQALANSSDTQTRASLQPLLKDATTALATIGKRGQGLMRFVTSYRTLSRLPSPKPATLLVSDAFRSVEILLGEQLDNAGIKLVTTCKPENLQLYVDADQLEQALINLLLNALDAVADVPTPCITLSGIQQEAGLVTISISDNGCGISAENIDNIFVPFFTTKRGGSGIGMSVVKQIVRANDGQINIISISNAGSTIRLSFSC